MQIKVQKGHHLCIRISFTLCIHNKIKRMSFVTASRFCASCHILFGRSGAIILTRKAGDGHESRYWPHWLSGRMVRSWGHCWPVRTSPATQSTRRELFWPHQTAGNKGKGVSAQHFGIRWAEVPREPSSHGLQGSTDEPWRPAFSNSMGTRPPFR